ncbi:MAG: small, acid-soluble spore protein, alpha/beta type [Syntrophomonadaceae bacterium]|jgi:small acid-soluble spore protein F (minor alpha/beta-type SASP)|nr:small, acid-soluble spore protein, alpha/beta type [Syntrophomonadaceae bacterium]
MGRKRSGLMSDELKWELAKELGVDHIVAREGFGGVSSRDCGNLVKLAIMKAEQSLKSENSRRQS